MGFRKGGLRYTPPKVVPCGEVYEHPPSEILKIEIPRNGICSILRLCVIYIYFFLKHLSGPDA